MSKENNMTDPFDWINAEYYWEDDVFFMDRRDNSDPYPCDNPFVAPVEFDPDEDYPFDPEQYEEFLDQDCQ